jgi:hypothetical protein
MKLQIVTFIVLLNANFIVTQQVPRGPGGSTGHGGSGNTEGSGDRLPEDIGGNISLSNGNNDTLGDHSGEQFARNGGRDYQGRTGVRLPEGSGGNFSLSPGGNDTIGDHAIEQVGHSEGSDHQGPPVFPSGIKFFNNT